MTDEIKPLPSTLREGVEVARTPSGVALVDVDVAEAYEGQLLKAPGGFHYVAALPDAMTDYAPTLVDLSYRENDPIVIVDEYLAAQLALARLCLGLRWYAVKTEKLIKDKVLERSDSIYRLRTVHLDWLGQGTEEGQTRAMITEGAPTRYETQGLGTEYVENTAHVYAPGTVVRNYGEATCTLRLEVMFAHKDERRGFRGAFVRALLGDTSSDSGGQRVAVPEYFGGEVVRLSLDPDTGYVSYPDSGETAGHNKWLLVAEITAEVGVLGLVDAAAELEPSGGSDVG